MKTIVFILPFAAVFLIYNFVDHALGFAALVALIAVLAVLKWPTILMVRGNSKYSKGDTKGGLELMEKAYKTGKLDGQLTVIYSYCLISQGMNEKAHQVLDKYIGEGKGTKADICRAKHNKAAMLRREGKIREAFDLMKEVHGEIPATDTYATLGLIYLDMAKADPSMEEEAMTFLREAYDYNADDRTIADNLGSMYFRRGETEKAAEVYGKLLSVKQPSPTPYYRYAKVLEAQGNTEDAEDMLNKALRCSFAGVTAITREDVTKALDSLNKNQSENQ